MNKIIITGATGFIGSHITKSLIAHNYEVAIIVRHTSKLDMLEEIKDKIVVYTYSNSLEELILFFKQFQADAVIHLAANFVAEHNPSQVDTLLSSNIIFSTHIMEAMQQANVKNIINTSTSWQNYENRDYCPVSLYAATKQAVEDILLYYSSACDMNVVNLVIYDSYGANDPRSKIIALFTRISESQVPLDMSPGNQQIDLLYITDIVNAYLLTLHKLLDNTFI